MTTVLLICGGVLLTPCLLAACAGAILRRFPFRRQVVIRRASLDHVTDLVADHVTTCDGRLGGATGAMRIKRDVRDPECQRVSASERVTLATGRMLPLALIDLAVGFPWRCTVDAYVRPAGLRSPGSSGVNVTLEGRGRGGEQRVRALLADLQDLDIASHGPLVCARQSVRPAQTTGGAQTPAVRDPSAGPQKKTAVEGPAITRQPRVLDHTRTPWWPFCVLTVVVGILWTTQVLAGDEPAAAPTQNAVEVKPVQPQPAAPGQSPDVSPAPGTPRYAMERVVRRHWKARERGDYRTAWYLLSEARRTQLAGLDAFSGGLRQRAPLRIAIDTLNATEIVASSGSVFMVLTAIDNQGCTRSELDYKVLELDDQWRIGAETITSRAAC